MSGNRDFDSRAVLTALVASLLTTAVLILAFYRRCTPSQPNKRPQPTFTLPTFVGNLPRGTTAVPPPWRITPPAPSKELWATAPPPGELRLSRDAALKTGDFWLEQPLWLKVRHFSDDKGQPTGAAGKKPPLKTGDKAVILLARGTGGKSGVRLRLRPDELLLERLSPARGPNEADPASRSGKWKILARVKTGPIFKHVSPPARTPEEATGGAAAGAYISSVGKRAWPVFPGVLGVLKRGKELSVWWDDVLLLTWKGALDLRGPSAGLSNSLEVLLGPRRVLPLGAGKISFADDFMRTPDEADGAMWHPAGGRWELSTMSFPDRAANPFALCAKFDQASREAERLYRGRTRPPRVGLGIQPSIRGGLPYIARLSGGSPAARAGLREGDIFLAVNDKPVFDKSPWLVWRLLRGRRSGSTVRLKVVNPDEKNPREVVLQRRKYRWGAAPTQEALSPETDAAKGFIIGGDPGWSDYTAAVSVKPLGTGGFGLAAAVLSTADCLLLRRVSPAGPPVGRNHGFPVPPPASLKKHAGAKEKLQLVRIRNGRETVLAEREFRFRPYEFYRLALAWRGDEIAAYLDKNLLFRKTVKDLRRGGIALWAERGAPVFFDDVEVFSTPPALLAQGKRPNPDKWEAPHPAQYSPLLAGEADMAVWADPAREWRRNERSSWAFHAFSCPGAQKMVLKHPKFKVLEVRLHDPSPVLPPSPLVRDLRRRDTVSASSPASSSASSPETAVPTTSKKSAATRKPELPPTMAIADGKLYLFAADGRRGGPFKLGNGPFKQIILRETAAGVPEAVVDGRRFVLPDNSAAKKKPGKRNDTRRPLGDGTALRGLLNLGAPEAVRVSSSKVLEYTFDHAPVDWQVSSGKWGLLNKWICDPRWSWFGGRTATLAALWNKYIFSGDLTLDLYVATMMRRDEPPYERAGDIGVALCGDGENPDSGYLLWCGGGPTGGNRWTRLYRKGRMVAETAKENARFPNDRLRRPLKPELHQRWFHLRVEKIGGRIRFYRDGVLALSFDDPHPLAEGRPGFFILRNGFLLSRVRLAYGRKRPASPLSRRSAPYDDGLVVNMYDGETPTLVRPEPLPAAVVASLSAPPDKFRPVSAPPPAADSTAADRARKERQRAVEEFFNQGTAGETPSATAGTRKNPAETERALRVRDAWLVSNGIGGGPLALQWRNFLFNPERRSLLRFAYRLPPAEKGGAKVDLQLLEIPSDGRFNAESSRAFRLRLTGPRRSSEKSAILGEIPVVADDCWHTVQIDLGPLWREFWRQRGFKHPGKLIVRPAFGNTAEGDGLLIGLNGNRVGARYAVGGLQLFDVRKFDHDPPRLTRVVFPYDDDGDGRTIKLVFDDRPAHPARSAGPARSSRSAGSAGGQKGFAPVFSGLDERSLKVRVNGRPLSSDDLSFNHLTQTVTIDPCRLRIKGQAPANSEKEPGERQWEFVVRVEAFADRAGNKHPGDELERRRQYTAADVRRWAQNRHDKGPKLKTVPAPTPPTVHALLQGDSPQPAGDVGLKIKDVMILGGRRPPRLEPGRDAPAQATVKQSLRVVAPRDGCTFGFTLRKPVSVNLGRRPWLELVYRIPPETPVALRFRDAEKRLHALLLTDRCGKGDYGHGFFTTGVMGPPAGFRADGTWRRLLIPLGKMFVASDPGSRSLKAGAFAFGDFGWPGNRQGMHYEINTVRFVPAARATDLSFTWACGGLLPAVEVASAVDDRPDTVPTGLFIKQGESLARAFSRAGKRRPTARDGWKYLHLRYKNAAGLWSPTVHYPFYLDNTPPRVVRTKPETVVGKDGIKTGTLTGATLRFFIEEATIVNEKALRLRVGPATYTVAGRGLSYDAASGELTFNGAKSIPAFRPRDGDSATVELSGLRDTAGNVAPPLRYRFSVKHSLDRKGPRLLRARFTVSRPRRGMPTDVIRERSLTLDFEDTLGHVRPLRDCRLEWTDDPQTAAYGQRAVKAICLTDGGDMQLRLHDAPFSLRRYSLLLFDYKAEPGAAVDLLVEAFGRHYTIRFMGDGKGPNPRGAVAGVVADGKWHRAAVDLADVLAKDIPSWPLDAVARLTLTAGGDGRGRTGTSCRRGAALWLDNLELAPPRGTGGRVEWETATDASGLTGWAVVTDDKPETVPPPRITTTTPRCGAGGLPGISWVHIRAEDQAGNWGPTFHYRLDCGGKIKKTGGR